MKTLLSIVLILLVPGVVCSQEKMTPELFKKLVETPGDTKALSTQLAKLPFWVKSQCRLTLKYADGSAFKEECIQTSKTIDGRYVVFSTDSQLYKMKLHCIAEYDEKASAHKLWGLLDDTLSEATIIIDQEKKITASTCNFKGLLELSVGSYSDQEMSCRTLTYKDGVLFVTREMKATPIIAKDKD